MSLNEIANQLVARGKGIMAADRPAPNFRELLKEEGVRVLPDDDTYRAWTELLFTAPQLNEYVSGIIMTPEQLTLRSRDGGSLLEYAKAQGMTPGISPATGMVTLAGTAGEVVGAGLDGLRERFAEYAALGVGFSKWRAAIRIGADTPSEYAVSANAYVMAQCAALSQEAGIVPIVEPEIELTGDHSIERCFEVTEWVLKRTFEALYLHRVELDGTLVKASMVVSGADCPVQADVDAVAALTVEAFRRAVPAAIPGIVFLSGGQSDWKSTAHMNAMNAQYDVPWALSFSYARALQRVPMKVWRNEPANIPAAQAALRHRAKMNALASMGQWSPELED